MYYRDDKVYNFSKILAEALSSDSIEDRQQKKHLFENDKQRIRAMNVLAGHQLHLTENEHDA